jgi:hypothetical protein
VGIAAIRGRYLPHALLLLLLAAPPAGAQKDGRNGILRGLIDGLSPAGPAQRGAHAGSAHELSDALRRYGELCENRIDQPDGVRAALRLGSYYYTVGHVDQALPYFERALAHARGPELRAEAAFWCEQARLMAGAEPLAWGSGGERRGFYGVLRRLCRVDRAILRGRTAEAEPDLESLETEARNTGCAGLALARWGRLEQTSGSSRSVLRDLLPLARAAAQLPERAFFDFSLVEEPPSIPTPARWSIQFGAFLEAENAELMERELSLQGISARIETSEEKGRTWNCVRYGDFLSRAEADSAAEAVRAHMDVPLQIVQAP